MNNWGRIGVFDLETTGVEVDTARIVSACVAILDADGSVITRWDWLANPGIEIPASAAAVHGITTEHAHAHGRDAQTVVGEITQSLRVIFALGVPLVVYNSPYDLTLLDRECRRHQLTSLNMPKPIIDPLVLDKHVDKYRKGKRTLEATAARYKIPLAEAHDAGADAIAAGRLAQGLAAAFPQELSVDVVELHDLQSIWYAEQAASFADYIRRTKGDQDFVADTSWPMRVSNHLASILDTQPIQAPSPRPSRTVPHLDFSTGVLTLEEPVPAATAASADTAISDTEIPKKSETGQGNSSEEVLSHEAVALDDGDSGTADLSRDPTDDITSAAVDSPSVVTEEVSATRTALRPTTVRLAAAIITDSAGRALLVRHRGSSIFLQPSAKIERGESAVDALSRELFTELGLELDLGVTEYLGSFRSDASHEAETVTRAEVFALICDQNFSATEEIEELTWIDNEDPAGIELDSLTRDVIVPLWITRRADRL
ncbi:MAG: exonuclease domain-containing protein [Rhodoglobus sp.]